jgi:hypothetical protein
MMPAYVLSPNSGYRSHQHPDKMTYFLPRVVLRGRELGDSMTRSRFWAITQCSLLKLSRRLSGAYCLYLQSRKVSQASN